MKNTFINLEIIKRVATALGTLNDDVIYVGGATVSLYINDPAAEDVRPTKDIDISIKIVSLHHLEEIRQQLINKGFIQNSDLDVICRFTFNDILVDVMSTIPVGWAPANPWFASGFEHLEYIYIEDTRIQIMPLSYFLASKFAAYHNRGGKDPRFSHDFEDIIYILDNRTDWELILQKTNPIVKQYLVAQLLSIKNSNRHQEAILAHLYYETQEERFKKIMRKIDFLVT